MNLVWCLPFAGLLGTIALAPFLMPNIWHHHYGKLTLFWSLLFFVPFALNVTPATAFHVLTEALFIEYLPFILLLLALFIVSGGIHIKLPWSGTPRNNVLLLTVGTCLASVTGTTGAAILLIRPLIQMNQHRKQCTHTLVFFIFLVANIGGALTPLGDPPLFLGFLNGIHFFWVTKHLLFPVVITTAVLLGIYYVIDQYYYKQDHQNNIVQQNDSGSIFIFSGKGNLILLFAIVLSVFLSGFWQGATFFLFSVPVSLSDIVRTGLLIIICLISLWITPKELRQHNQFTYDPVIEVAKLFAGIFITIIPVIAILKLGESGDFATLINLVSQNNAPIPGRYFWVTGLLSAFLDNAPTYLVFFNLASGDAAHLMTIDASTLRAISMGSVFMGSLTYMGNAPNFIIRNIASQNKINMPGFFGYMKWSLPVLLPLFLLLTWLFF